VPEKPSAGDLDHRGAEVETADVGATFGQGDAGRTGTAPGIEDPMPCHVAQ
jgi:hypothetical protein